MYGLRNLALLSGTAAAALVAWGCDQQPNAAAPEIGAPQAHFTQPGECVPFKMTGGGRIDYPPGTAEKNDPASHIYETFGAHVMSSGQLAQDGVTCLADKGALQWIDHRPDFRVGGQPLNLHATEITFAEAFFAPETDCEDGAARWGGKLRVRNTGQEDLDFEVFDCDNGEPGAGHDGFAIRVPGLVVNGVPYAVECPDPTLPPAEPTCTLTGGNRQFHPTH